MAICFSIIMPTYNQCCFIRRAVQSVMEQQHRCWELIIVNDGSTDETEEYISDFLSDERIKYVHNAENRGLGYSLNIGLSLAKYDYIAYLPSDDFYFKNHLSSLAEKLENNNVFLAYSGLRWDNRDSLHSAKEIETASVRKGYSMQLAQVSHRKCNEKWVERAEWISDDLFSMYWNKLLDKGYFVTTNQITAFWTSHPWQRHLIINEKYGGGINKVRSFYHIKSPIKIKVAKEKFIDEEELYIEFRVAHKPLAKPLKIVIVGELAYNPQRIYALEEAGHKLYGLWVPYPNLSFSTVGPLPFGNVEDIPLENWKERIREIKPDVIYAMLNWGAIDWAYEVMREMPDIPFAWHYKEGPFVAIGAGNWDKLIYLYRHSDLKIYLNKTVKRFFEQFIPKGGLSMIMDGDLPKKEYFRGNYSEKLSATDGEVHTVCAGRLMGIGEKALSLLVSHKIHLHLYIENFHASKEKVFSLYKRKYPNYFHLHNHCSADKWSEEFSKYDAGWLHHIRSHNEGDLLKVTWDDLNLPARISSYAAAGIPVIYPNNEGNIVAIEETLKDKKIGVLFNNFNDLSTLLNNKKFMSDRTENMKRHRMEFCFDYYVPELITMFYKVIEKKENERA